MSYEVFGDGEDSPFETAIEAGWIDPDNLSKALLDVMNERHRQWDEENFDPSHDDQYVKGELISGALCYATHAEISAKLLTMGLPEAVIVEKSAAAGTPPTWPWAGEWWKPKDARRNLVRAAALLVAEIERLDRDAKRWAEVSADIEAATTSPRSPSEGGADE